MILVESLSKFYEPQKALNKVSFSISKGEIVGLLGPNGAGKSTLMKIITGYIDASEGNVELNGVKVADNKREVQKIIGYLSEQNPLYKEMYVREYLKFIAEIHETSIDEIEEVIQKVGLTQEAHKKIESLSKGYKQRVGIAAAILHNPKILILDEPTTGLDPSQLIEIRELIRALGKNKIVIFSTHIMQEVEAVCDRVLIINKGSIVADENLDKFKNDQKQIIEVSFDFQIEKQFLLQMNGIELATNMGGCNWELLFSTSKDKRPEVFDFANQNGLKILQLNRKNKNLESLFLDLVG